MTVRRSGGIGNVSRVLRSRKQAKDSYDKLSRFYDLFSSPFERKYQDVALGMLGIKNGEKALEIGFGTGYCLARIAESVGNTGKAYGIDISPGMANETRLRLEREGLSSRVELTNGDAIRLPYLNGQFDIVFMSFTLELFDTPKIPRVLSEARRVLEKGGRIGVVSLSREGGVSMPIKIYEWFHAVMPDYVDCRPIFAENP